MKLPRKSLLNDAQQLATQSSKSIADERYPVLFGKMDQLRTEIVKGGSSYFPASDYLAREGASEILERGRLLQLAIRRAAQSTGIWYSTTLASDLEGLYAELFAHQVRIVKAVIEWIAVKNGVGIEAAATFFDGSINQAVNTANSGALAEIQHYVQALRTERRQKVLSGGVKVAFTGLGFGLKALVDAWPQLINALRHHL